MYDKHYRGHRPGFSMIVAIFVVLIVAWLASQVLNMSAKESKGTGDRYLLYQAELLADSATDYAVMRIGDYDETVNNNCLRDISITVNDASNTIPMYDINMRMYYSYQGAAPANCPAHNVLSPAVGTGLDSMVLIDTTVTVRADSNLSTEPIRVHRRSWQKP